MNGHRVLSTLALPLAMLAFGAAPARAASLQKVEQATWSVSGLPSYVNMYVYVPDKLAENAPILVASHHCGGSANSTFNEIRSTLVSLADTRGFLIVFPEATGHNCWDVGSAKSLKHDGGGDTHAVAQMVRYALTKYGANASRVYAFGTSSGAMMTEALMGVYPDVFVAGVSVAGVPCGCWAEQYSGDSGANPQWSGPCAGGNVSKSAQEWGDLVRSMFPGYTGHRPRVQLWHGTADTTISYKNLGESVKEWTNILQLDATPTATDSAKSGYEHQVWKNGCGYVDLETWSQQGAGHDVSWDSASAIRFLGLDQPGAQDPEIVACAGGMSGAAGSAGSDGAAGMRGAGSGAVSAGVGGSAKATGGAAAAGRGGAVGAAGARGSSRAGVGGSADPKDQGGQMATNAGTQGTAGTPAAPSSNMVAERPSENGASSGCSCVVDARAPTTNLALFALSLSWFIRRRWRT